MLNNSAQPINVVQLHTQRSTYGDELKVGTRRRRALHAIGRPKIDLSHDKCSTLPLSHLLNVLARLPGVFEMRYDGGKLKPWTQCNQCEPRTVARQLVSLR